MTMVRIFAKLVARDPAVALRHFACLSSFAWQPNQPKGVYLETVVFNDFDFSSMPEWQPYQELVSQHSLLPAARSIIERAVKFEWRIDPAMIMWRPAIYMYLFLASMLFLVVTTKKWTWLLLAVPLVMQTAGIMFTAQVEALRYQYPVYLISLLFTVPLLFMAIATPRRARQVDLKPDNE